MMTTGLIPEKGNTLFIAHRGVAYLECENTMAAFIAAGNRSYFGIETDVHVTADGEYVLCHDDNTGRVASRDVEISNCRLKELQEIPLIDKDGSTDRADLRIPLLKDYAKICKKYGKTAVIELKDDFTDVQLDEIYEICRQQGDIENTIYISFNYSDIKRMKERHPDIGCQFLTSEPSDEVLDRLERDKIDIDVYWECMDETLYGKCRAKGIRINCWTLDRPSRARELIALGVDYITADWLE